MTVEISLLKALSIKSNLLGYRHLINPKSLSSQSTLLLKDFDVYFIQNQEAQQIDFSDFGAFFFNVRHPYLDENSVLEYKEVLRLLNECANSASIDLLIAGFKQQEFYSKIQRLIDKNIDVHELKEQVVNFSSQLEVYKNYRRSDGENNLEEALTAVDRTGGLAWRLSSLRNHFGGGLIKGDFGIIAGYTDSGKTSFLSSELTYMASQMTGDQYVLWLNNEGDWKRILPRLYCSALNITQQQLTENKERAKIEYHKLMNGDANRIRVMDIQGNNVRDIERLIKERPPSMLVLDMLDNVDGFENYMGGSEGSNVRYGKLYQWAREMAAEHCPIIATSQLNREGSNIAWPKIVDLKGSGVDKQGAAVFILMIGAITGNDTIRYLSTPKFKIGSNKSWHAQVTFDPARARFL